MTQVQSKPVALITGVSGGFGRAFASNFSKAGFLIAGVARNPDSESVDLPIAADLTRPDALSSVVETVMEKFGRLDLLVNNAGIGQYEVWEEMDTDDLRRLMELNFFVPVQLTRLALPLLKISGGTIINVSSVAGKVPVPVMGGYCASKYALNAFSDSLRAELSDSDVHVLNLIVGRINTGFSSRALGKRTPPRTPFSGTPDKLSEKTVRCWRRRKRQLIFPGWYRLIIWAYRLAPGLLDRLAAAKWRQSDR